MKNILLLLTISTALLNVRAQDTNQLPALGVTPFYNESEDALGLSNELYEAVTRRLIQSRRFRVIDIPKRKNAQAELENMRRREFIEREIIEVGKSTPAEYLLVGFIRNSELLIIDSTQSEVRVDFEVKYIDVKTGEAIDAQAFTGTSWSKPEIGKDFSIKLFKSGEDKAVAALDELNEMLTTSQKGKIIDAVDNSADHLFKWVVNTSSSNLYFLKVNNKRSSKKVKRVVIGGGRDVGLEKGMRLRMVIDEVLTDPHGREVLNEKPIARLKVIDVRSQTSACKVLKRETDVLPHINDKNLRIIFDLN